MIEQMSEFPYYAYVTDEEPYDETVDCTDYVAGCSE